MKVWLRVPFSILALLAMLATMLPGTLWACPMTGRIDTAARVCAMAMPGGVSVKQGEMPCAQMGGKCCKPVSAPTSQDDDSGRPAVFAASHAAALAFAPALPAFDATPFVLPRFDSFEAPAVRLFLARFTNSPPSFWTQHRPISRAGRAPPVL